MNERILHWGYLNYEDIPIHLCLYRHIEEIYLKENRITTIPEWFLCIKTLKFINLAGNNIAELPNEIHMLENLQYLDISENRLSELPASLCQLPVLQHLNVSSNQLKQLPKSFNELQFLEYLNVSNNQLECLPIELSECKRLQVLELNGNCDIWHIPERIAGMTSLQTFMIDRCSLLYLPANLSKSIEFLRIFDNINVNHIPIIYETFYQTYYELPTIVTNKKAVVTKYLFAILENEMNKRLILPIGTRQIYSTNDPSYPVTLYNSCLRTLERINQSANFYNKAEFMQLLPEGYIRNNIKIGPIARCCLTECSNSIFTSYYFIVAKRRDSTSRQLFSAYFCTQYCALQWLAVNQKNYYEVLWTIL